jgi:hypothetical protein
MSANEYTQCETLVRKILAKCTELSLRPSRCVTNEENGNFYIFPADHIIFQVTNDLVKTLEISQSGINGQILFLAFEDQGKLQVIYLNDHKAWIDAFLEA